MSGKGNMFDLFGDSLFDSTNKILDKLAAANILDDWELAWIERALKLQEMWEESLDEANTGPWHSELNLFQYRFQRSNSK